MNKKSLEERPMKGGKHVLASFVNVRSYETEMPVLTHNYIRVHNVIPLQMLISPVTSSASIIVDLLSFVGTFLP